MGFLFFDILILIYKRKISAMKYVKLFEEYDRKLDLAIKKSKDIMGTKAAKRVIKIVSIIDDLVHLDFKNIKNSFKNKEGFQKTSDLLIELGYVVNALKPVGGVAGENELEASLLLFYTLKNYNIDIDMILNYLENEDVINYLKSDKRASKRVDKFEDAINFLKKYKNWLSE